MIKNEKLTYEFLKFRSLSAASGGRCHTSTTFSTSWVATICLISFLLLTVLRWFSRSTNFRLLILLISLLLLSLFCCFFWPDNGLISLYSTFNVLKWNLYVKTLVLTRLIKSIFEVSIDRFSYRFFINQSLRYILYSAKLMLSSWFVHELFFS